MDTPTSDIEETLEAQPHGGSLKRTAKKVCATGTAYYGATFDGYMKVDEYRDLIPAFKELYYQRMVENTKSRLTHVLREFNEQLCIEDGDDTEDKAIRKFHPNTTTVRRWKKKWDMDIMEKKGMALELIDEKKNVQQVLKTRAVDGAVREYIAPEHEALEKGLQTLGGELMNDALQMIRDDQNLEDIYDSDELIKRKNYVVNVFGHVTKMVHGKASLMLKASAEKRESAGFMMDLMKMASSGEMTVEAIQELKADYQPKKADYVQES